MKTDEKNPNPWKETRKFFRTEFDIDVIKQYTRLKEFATIPIDKLTDRYELAKEINRSARNAYLANVIFLKARKQRELFRIEYDRKLRELTRIALARIESWMDDTGSKKKQITKEMISQEIAAKEDTREKYQALIKEQEELREIRDALQKFSLLWYERKGSLQTQASLLRQQQVVMMGDNK
mgnify:CR=1 FL=1|jgi:hypothetical protein